VRVVRILITGYSQKLSENSIQNGRIKQKMMRNWFEVHIIEPHLPDLVL
jgi:predicted amino acid-binding ACT domain protein